jgi:hypothetical protein
MPLTEPYAVDGMDGVIAIKLFALGTVYVRLGVGSTSSSGPRQFPGARSTEEVVIELCAAAALPYGLLPVDFAGANVANGELVADMPAPLVEWAASGGRRACPRVPGAYPPDAMDHRGRARLALDGSRGWTLEVAGGADWTPARGGVD